MKKYAGFMVYLLFVKLSFAQVPHFYALHINGIDTTRKEAEINRTALTQVNSNMVTWGLVYNQTVIDQGK